MFVRCTTYSNTMTTINNLQLTIYKLKKKIQKANRQQLPVNCSEGGFTLIELLAVMVVLVVTSAVIGATLSSSLRGTTKTTTINNVRQNGSYALSNMSKMIRDAKKFNGVKANAADAYITDCTVAAITPTPTPVQYKYLKITSFDGQSTVFNLDCANRRIASNSADLIDTTVATLDSSAVCYFTCTQVSRSDYPTIGISFTLVQPTTGPNFFEQRSSRS